MSGKLEYEPQIIRLEKVCSSLFAISFLIFMNLLGLLFFFLIISSLLALWLEFFPYQNEFSWLNWMITTVILIYLIDYLTLGWLKRLPYINKIYYPLYRVMVVITLSPLSRNIYYGLATNHKPWKVVLFLVFFIVSSMAGVIFLRGNTAMGTTVRTSTSLALELRPQLNATDVMYHGHYRDQMRDEPSQQIWIPSANVQGQILQAFVVHTTRYEEFIIKPSCDYDSLSQVEGTNLDSLKLACLKQFYRLKINEELADAKMYYQVNLHTSQDGLMSYVDISALPRGGHVLSLYYYFYDESSGEMVEREVASLELYKERPAERESVRNLKREVP